MQGLYEIWTEVGSYYGVSKDVRSRINSHQYCLRRGKHHNWKLQQAWDDGYLFYFRVILAEDDLSLLGQLETEYIDADENCLNLGSGYGVGLTAGPRHIPIDWDRVNSQAREWQRIRSDEHF